MPFKPVRRAYRLLHPKLTLFLVTKWKEKVNVMALAWAMPIDDEANLIGISVHEDNYSYKLLTKSKEFVLCVPSMKQLSLVWKVGTTTGADIDKIKEFGIKLEDGVKISTPHLKNCLGFLECEVEKSIKTGEHTLFIARVVYAAADSRYFDKVWKASAKPLFHIGSRYFATIGELKEAR